MTVIDARGRLFGRINLIDALLGVVVLLLIPLLYGAFALFRVPTPAIATVEPARVAPSQPTTVVMITGDNLRPFLTAYAGTVRASEYALISSTRARLTFTGLEPGTYDIALFDQLQELTRKPAALTVTSMPRTVATLSVEFIAAPEVIAHLHPGLTDTPGRDPKVGRAVLVDIGAERKPTQVTVQYWSLVNNGAADRSFFVPQSMLEFSGIVRVPVTPSPAGWMYKDWPVGVGGRFVFDASTGATVVGWIRDVQLAEETR